MFYQPLSEQNHSDYSLFNRNKDVVNDFASRPISELVFLYGDFEFIQPLTGNHILELKTKAQLIKEDLRTK